MTIRMDEGAAELLDTLHRAGYAAYVVGGCVRDSLLGLTPHDWDLCTSALPQQVMELFGAQRCIPTGLQHGTVTVKQSGALYEITTFRTEGTYTDGRHPDEVHFVPDVREDLARRDFTINAMAICLNKARFGELVDPFDGIGDLWEGIIRTPLDPDVTFSDDPLRMLRCVRFATQLNFFIEEETFEALSRNAERIRIISGERIAEELCKFMASQYPSKGFFELQRCGLLGLIIPELTALDLVETRNGRAHKNNFHHTLEVLENVARAEERRYEQENPEQPPFKANIWLRWAVPVR